MNQKFPQKNQLFIKKNLGIHLYAWSISIHLMQVKQSQNKYVGPKICLSWTKNGGFFSQLPAAALKSSGIGKLELGMSALENCNFPQYEVQKSK